MTVNENTQAIIKEELLPRVVDAVSGGNFFATRMLTSMKDMRSYLTGKAVKYQAAGNGKSFSGLETLNTNLVPTKIKLQFDPRQFSQPVVISGIEKDVNAAAGADRSAELAALALEEAQVEMADAIGDILYGDGTGSYSSGAIVSDSSNKNFIGLAGNVDDGGEVDSHGGKSRSTYSVLQSYETDLGGALTLAAMRTAYSGVTTGSDKPTIIVTTESIWNSYENLHTVTVDQDGYAQIGAIGRPTRGLQLNSGFDAMWFKGVPVVADEKAPSGTMWFINEKYMSFYGLPATVMGYEPITLKNEQLEGYYSQDVKKSLGFSASEMVVPTNQYGEIGHLLLQGNMFTFFPKRHGVINTIS